MVSHKRLPQEDDSEVLFEVPVHEGEEIELQEISTHNKQDHDEQVNLLSSFQTDSSDETDSDEFSLAPEHTKRDVRLNSSNEHTSGESAALHDRINRTLMTTGASSSSLSANANPHMNSSQDSPSNTIQPQDLNPNSELSKAARIKSLLSFNSIRNNFNFLDRVYRPLPVNRSSEMGSGSDGVFSNLSAKPDLQSNPVESDKPPTYDEVSQDQTPPYWENSVLSPGFMDEVFIDGLPVGNIVNFVWNLLVSAGFQFVGFLLTYLLHTSHAAKHGSRAGLGVTFIVYGYMMFPKKPISHDGNTKLQDYEIQPDQPSDYANVGTSAGKIQGSLDQFTSNLPDGVSNQEITETRPPHLTLIGIGVVMIGVFILVKACVNYHRAKKMEDVILQPPSASAPVSPEEQV